MSRADQGNGQMRDEKPGYATTTASGLEAARTVEATVKRRAKHVHRFIIPVEWQYELEAYTGNGPIPPQLVYKTLRTTKLRCSECPEEVER
jgi:hypothetical protein